MENNAIITFKRERAKYVGIILKENENHYYVIAYLKKDKSFLALTIKNLDYSICNDNIDENQLAIYNAFYKFFIKEENDAFLNAIFKVRSSTEFSATQINYIFDLDAPGIKGLDLRKTLELLKFIKNECKNPQKIFKMLELKLEQVDYIFHEDKLFKPCKKEEEDININFKSYKRVKEPEYISLADLLLNLDKK